MLLRVGEQAKCVSGFEGNLFDQRKATLGLPLQCVFPIGRGTLPLRADAHGLLPLLRRHQHHLESAPLPQADDPAVGVARSYISSEIKKGSPFNNVGGYSNPKVDELFAQGAKEPNPAKRAALYAEVQAILADDAVAGWLLELNFPTVYRTKINNLVSSAVGINDSLGRASIN